MSYCGITERKCNTEEWTAHRPNNRKVFPHQGFGTPAEAHIQETSSCFMSSGFKQKRPGSKGQLFKKNNTSRLQDLGQGMCSCDL